ncbi:calcineurin-like phosphoesterase [Pseudomassariella vexata]|uniref:Calcineurin-like phosphoesterase n=1 Tax=Pseudomassariella vexata TaxID=1141098 RepID=A0A1Y2E791_9PEZI|nr:calcineurin-like phosphoesterase [Pseudomassariella vexata]ORY67412.1 calcineurin-like phosphoesterase [Pseudomassariella vexata]
MFPKSALAAASLAALTRAAQPGAAAPVAAPLRDLEWGQINFLHTTDTHGWHGGHLQEPQYSADWGDYVSFAEHMKKKADDQGVDLLLIDTGDRIEGNGLYDASDPKGKYTYDIFSEQSIDVICTGNHELYQADAVTREHDITVPNFKDSYLASNLDYIEPETGNQIPQAKRYRKFKTKNQGLNIVALGFLFNFDRNANNSVVIPVEETIKEQWFLDAIREKPDLFVVTGHVGLRMKEFEQIYKVIRDQNWYTPIVFFGGHAHVRDTRKFDDNAFAIASGRYFETIGWMSIDGVTKKGDDEFSAQASASFKRRYIDNNLFGLQYHTGLNETTFPTEHGRNVTKMIADGRKALNLDKTFGCAPQDLWMSRAEYPSNSSIFTWLEELVMPDIVVNKERADVPRLAITNTGMIRFDIFKGAFTIDSTYIVSPFVSMLNYIPNVPYNVAKKVMPLLNNGGQLFAGNMDPALDAKYLVSPEQWSLATQPQLENLETESPVHFMDTADGQKPLGDGDSSERPGLIGGYTTKDDLGDNGDDTVHSPLKFYAVPNCIQTEIDFPIKGDPDKVDLVFVDYVQPWVIMALKFSGGDYSTDDVKVWSNETVTDMIAGWIWENWKVDC